MTRESNPPIYIIRLKENLSIDQQHWFEDMQITNPSGGITLLTGPITDQAALYGLLNRISAMGLTLVSVNPIELRSEPEEKTP